MRWRCSRKEPTKCSCMGLVGDVVGVCVKTNIQKQFREYIKGFTTQPVDLLLWDTDNLFVCTAGKPPKVDMKHSFWRRFPNAFWAMRIIIDAFLDAYTNFGSRDDFQIAAMEETQTRLNKRLNTFMPGMEIDLITALSAERYESEAATALKLLLLPGGIPLSLSELQENVVFFEQDQRLELSSENTHALRKQLNMAKAGCLVVGYNGSSSVQSLGVGNEKLLELYPYLSFQEHMIWSFHVPPLPCDVSGVVEDGCRLRYCRGRLMLPLLDMSQAEQACIYKGTREKCDKTVISRVLELVKHQKKGTVIVLADEEFAQEEANRLCKNHHEGIMLERTASLLEENSFSIIQHLTAIDGALLVDFNGQCYACGMILDGKADGKGNMARGARFNSALNYTRSHKNRFQDHPMVVIVASEDGMLNILGNNIFSALAP